MDRLPLMGRYLCKQISPFWLENRDVQERNEVRWRLDVFRKQMYSFEKSDCDIVVTF